MSLVVSALCLTAFAVLDNDTTATAARPAEPLGPDEDFKFLSRNTLRIDAIRDTLHYRSTASFLQRVPLVGAEKMILVSSRLPHEISVERCHDCDVLITCVVAFSVVGYHGMRGQPFERQVARDDAEFKVRRDPGELFVRSREWLYIHHAVEVEELSLRVPEDLELVIWTPGRK